MNITLQQQDSSAFKPSWLRQQKVLCLRSTALLKERSPSPPLQMALRMHKHSYGVSLAQRAARAQIGCPDFAQSAQKVRQAPALDLRGHAIRNHLKKVKARLAGGFLHEPG